MCSKHIASKCQLLITFPDSLDPDQNRQNVGTDLDPNSFSLFDTLMVFLKEFFEKDDFEKNQRTTKHMKKLSSMRRVKATNCKVNLRLIVGDFTHAICLWDFVM